MPLLIDVRRRQRLPEIMDQPGLEPERHLHALRGLERINRYSGSAGILWPALQQLAREQHTPLRVLDVASGGGDVAVRLARRARREVVALELAGCDISPTAVAYARQRAQQDGVDVSFLRADALRDELPDDYDVVVCSLFLHHLDEDQAVALLRRLGRAARRAVLINDLERCTLGYVLAWVGSRLLSRSPVVHVDGPRSVAGAFTVDEARTLAERAGLEGASVARCWPCRFLLSWRRPA